MEQYLCTTHSSCSCKCSGWVGFVCNRGRGPLPPCLLTPPSAAVLSGSCRSPFCSVCLVHLGRGGWQVDISSIPRPPQFLILQFVFTMIHKSRRVVCLLSCYCEHNPNSTKRGERRVAWEMRGNCLTWHIESKDKNIMLVLASFPAHVWDSGNKTNIVGALLLISCNNTTWSTQIFGFEGEWRKKKLTKLTPSSRIRTSDLWITLPLQSTALPTELSKEVQ